MPDVAKARSRLFEVLRRLTLEERAFEDYEEIYYDLKLSGQDLFQLLSWISKELGVDFSDMDVAKYAPQEGMGLIKPVLDLLGLRPYRSLRIRDLLRAIEFGRWRN